MRKRWKQTTREHSPTIRMPPKGVVDPSNPESKDRNWRVMSGWWKWNHVDCFVKDVVVGLCYQSHKIARQGIQRCIRKHVHRLQGQLLYKLVQKLNNQLWPYIMVLLVMKLLTDDSAAQRCWDILQEKRLIIITNAVVWVTQIKWHAAAKDYLWDKKLSMVSAKDYHNNYKILTIFVLESIHYQHL